ncbi:hypothetical protein [Erythrobacter sp.]|uniref:hypothetical protein n=1 Tax=Erythrobacter sp. TaxID=1042 RepID=UPI0025F598FF|nr:hypothetical protein [Erythrobacter sp.]
MIEALAAGQWRLSIDGRELVTTRELELVQGAIYQACLDVIHHRPEWQALIHGAAIAWAGSAIGLAAPSGSGKSTLSALLVARGWTYVAEDLLAILPHGKVAPWPLPISVKPGSVAVISAAWPGGLGEPRAHPGKAIMARMLHVPPDRCATAALPLKALVLPRYDPDGDDALQPLWPLHALARLAWDRLWIGYPLTRERVERFIRWLAAMPCYEIAYRRIEAIDAHFRHIAGGAHA